VGGEDRKNHKRVMLINGREPYAELYTYISPNLTKKGARALMHNKP
jgi:hypothetical protein